MLYQLSYGSEFRLERAMGVEPTTNGLEGRHSTTELRPQCFLRRWAEVDLNHRRLSHQIYSLIRLTAPESTRN